MAESVIKDYFPSQIVSDEEKSSLKYGLEVARAIEQEWFRGDNGANRYQSNQAIFHNRRLYSRGEQSVQQYKDELAIDGDLSYLNLDWKIAPIIPKFVDIIVNGISERQHKVKATSIDEHGINKRTKYMESILRDMDTQELSAFAAENFGVNLQENDPNLLPHDQAELDLHMLMSYKDNAEVAEEAAINKVFTDNRFPNILKRVAYDITSIGIGATKDRFSIAEGIKVEYVDPANMVWSFTDDPFFEDIYYAGEVKTIHANELLKQFPDLTEDELKEIVATTVQQGTSLGTSSSSVKRADSNSVQILYFDYKTYVNEVYKIKTTSTGGLKAIEKTDQFNPPSDLEGDYEKVSRSIEVLYEGAYIMGTNKIIKWEVAQNQVREGSELQRVKMNYSICAPRMYNGEIESTVGRIIGFGDMIQLTHLKIQQVLSRLVPDGIYLDVDGLSEIDLGNGTNYNPAEAVKMFFQTGSVVGRSFTQEGDQNPGKVPIQELSTGSGNGKLQSLVATYNFYMQMIRDATGLNEARDGSTPDPKALVGVQKLAAANSNTATRHIVEAVLFIAQNTADNLTVRISDVIEYSPMKTEWVQSIGAHNVAILEELSELHLRDFGIKIELMPDEEERQKFAANIQMALSKGLIDLDDSLDIEQVSSIKVATQLLKLAKRKKSERLHQEKQDLIRVQSEEIQKQSQAASQAEMQKGMVINNQTKDIETFKDDIAAKALDREVVKKKELMQFEFDLAVRLETATSAPTRKDQFTEDNKNQRELMKEGNKKEMHKEKLGVKKFESKGNDVLNGKIDLGSYEPR